jgi:predicted RecB family nuclease
MRYEAGKRLFSATDLVNYVGCSHATWLDLHCSPDKLGESEEDDEAKLLKDKGIEHERNYRDRLIASGRTVTSIPDDLPLSACFEQSLAAMKRGDDVVYQAALLRDDWHGYVDFLIRVDGTSTLGPHCYEVSDTKLAHSPKPQYVVQLCVYAYLLELAQGHLPHSVSLELGNGETARFCLADFVHYVTLARERFSTFVSHPPSASQAEPCAHCDHCRWQPRCSEEWERIDHLCQIANIVRTQIQKLNKAGVHTSAALVDAPSHFSVPRIGVETLKRLRAQAALQLHKKRTGEDRVELIVPFEPARGFNRLPQLDPNDLFFDMEGDPHFPDGLEYLFGFCHLDHGKLAFKRFWAHSREEEKSALEGAMDFVMAHLEQHPNAHVYHYAPYEPNALKRLADSYGTRDQQLDWLLRNQKFVDLYKVVREGIQTSQPTYSLKDIERLYRSERTADLKTAGASVVVYEKWLVTHESKLLDDIARYNDDDCRSTYELREWLLTLRPSEASWFVTDVKKLEPETIEEINERQLAREALERRLMSCSPELKDMRTLICQLLDFHRREQKPEYWRMFARRDDYTDDDFINDVECLGPLNLSTSVQPYPVKQSTVYTYEFPEQDTKLDVGDSCQVAASLTNAGEIASLDFNQRTVGIKRGNRSGRLPTVWSAIPSPPLGNWTLRDALNRFAEAEANGENTYAAARRILLREPPKIKGLASGQTIAPEGADLVERSVDAVAKLDNSYLLIQGPPGAGKTVTASHIIVELIARGKRVAVSSNSHKTIHNLLDAIERLAQERRVSIRGAKKATNQNAESFYNSPSFRNVTKNEDVTRRFNLVAGTVYLFAELLDRVDYLVVDEAGQVSLANAVVMAMAADNIVLVGDQMQLGQPIQGSHPGESGSSVLDYLLRDQPTIRPERGVFLERTYRMHEDVCRFISEAVYDGRLKPAPDNQRQRLLLEAGADPRLRPTGLQFVEVNHVGCSQKSEEEAEVVRALYLSLLGQRFTDRAGVEHPMEHQNILVIAPYNLQVNHLKDVLPTDARVGTVDKFQGQEAEAVLVSMTTSSRDELPHDFEFLYNKNRLNVAISRARTFSCVIASPRLLEVSCSTVEQMKLANTLCWARRYGSPET